MQRIETVQLVALFPALTLLVILRRKIGFRLVKPTTLLVMAIIMVMSALFLPLQSKKSLIVYAGVMFVAGIVQRRVHWRSIKLRKDERHTRATGISYFDADWMLPIFLDERVVYRFFDPILCFLIGFGLWALKIQALAWWVLIGGMALMIFEQGYYERLLNRVLDIYDGRIEAAIQQEIATDFSKQPKAANKKLKARGLPSGIGTDIVEKVEKINERQ